MAKQLGARRSGKFKAVSTAPSFNKTPVGTSTPPLPYPVTQDLSSSQGTVKNVRFNGDPAYILNQSSQSKCIGDAAGIAKGIKSGTVSGEVKPVKGSSSVRVAGQPLIREGDPCTLNGGNCPGIYLTEPAPSGAIAGGAPTTSTNPPVIPETPQEQSWWSQASPWVHGALGVASFVPGLSVVTGAADAIIYGAEGNALEAGLAAASMIPGGKIATTAGRAATRAAKLVKGAHAGEEAAKAAKLAKEAKLAQDAREADKLRKAEQKAAQGSGKDTGLGGQKEPQGGAKIKGKKSAEKGKCGEWLAKLDMADEGFDEIVSIQNNSGHGVDLIGRNSKTGEVKVWEVKTTDGEQAPGLSKTQSKLGGERFTANRLGRASKGAGNYGKVPAAIKNANTSKKWIKDAKGNVSYQKREVFVDDLDKGCFKHPHRKSRSKLWDAKK